MNIAYYVIGGSREFRIGHREVAVAGTTVSGIVRVIRCVIVRLVGAAVCLPCLLTLLVAAGLGTAALSAIGSALSRPGLAVAAAVLALLLFAVAAIVFMRRLNVLDEYTD